MVTKTPRGLPTGLNPRQRSEFTRRSFEAKVVLLESWAASRVPDQEIVPWKPSELARWHDPARSIFAWRSPNVASPTGRYKDLRERFEEAIKALKRKAKKQQSPQQEMNLRRALRQIYNLEGQVEEIDAELRETKSTLSRVRDQLAASEAERSRLAQVVATLVPLRAAGLDNET